METELLLRVSNISVWGSGMGGGGDYPDINYKELIVIVVFKEQLQQFKATSTVSDHLFW